MLFLGEQLKLFHVVGFIADPVRREPGRTPGSVPIPKFATPRRYRPERTSNHKGQ